MAHIAERYSKNVIVTSDNPRNEKVEDICEQIISGFASKNHQLILNREEAIIEGINLMDGNSILLVLGKGRDDYQQIGNEKFTHSDIGIIKSQME